MPNETQHTHGPYKQLRQPTEIMIVANGHHLASVPLGGPIDRPEDEANANLFTSAPDLLAALKSCQRLINEALPKFNWGASCLDANAIKLLNDVPLQTNAALAKAEGK